MSTVYVTNRSNTHVYDSALRYGQLRFLTMGNYPIFKTDRLLEEIITAMNYSKQDDFLCFSGSAVISALCLTLWLEKHKVAEILLWDPSADPQCYVRRTVRKDQLRIEIERIKDQLEGRQTPLL